MSEHHEIAIIGSGFAGSLLARLLALSGRDVVLLERDDHPRFALGESSTPLGNLALAMARLAAPDDQPEPRQAAARRVRRAMAAQPFLVAGTGGFCTKVMEVTGERALVKTGAEGVYCAALTKLGLGVALKVDDGAGRAAESLMARLLVRLGVLSQSQAESLIPPILNRAGRHVGELRPASNSAF